MNQRIRDLRDLSLLDTALQGLAKRRDRKARAVSEAGAALAEAESGLTSKRDEIKALHVESDAMNLEVKSAEEQIAKLEGQRNTAKSNKEYEVFTREIDAAKEKMGKVEDDVLAELEKADELAAEEKSRERQTKDAAAALEAARRDVEETAKEFSSEEAELEQRRGEVAARIDPDDLTLYERILQMRKGSAVSAVVAGTCRACARKLTPQLENLVMIGNDLVQCMSCSRILYIDDAHGGS